MSSSVSGILKASYLCRGNESKRQVLLSLKDVLIVCRFITEKAETFYQQTDQLYEAKDEFGASLSDLVSTIQLDSSAESIASSAARLSQIVSLLAEILNQNRVQEVSGSLFNIDRNMWNKIMEGILIKST
jgi:hypothetical protein